MQGCLVGKVFVILFVLLLSRIVAALECVQMTCVGLASKSPVLWIEAVFLVFLNLLHVLTMHALTQQKLILL